MKIKSSLILLLVLVSVSSAGAKGKKQPERGMLEKMDSIPCGAKQRGLSGLGTVWASAGITHVNSDEKLCQEYLLRTDEMEYQIRPTDKHASILPIGREGTFKIKKDRMFLAVEDSNDKKMRAYQVVSMKPANPDSAAQNSSSKSSDAR